MHVAASKYARYWVVDSFFIDLSSRQRAASGQCEDDVSQYGHNAGGSYLGMEAGGGGLLTVVIAGGASMVYPDTCFSTYMPKISL